MRFLHRAVKARYRDERLTLLAIRRHVQPGDVVCDIGANKGSYLYWLSRWCRDGLVIAFEPQPVMAEYLAGLRGLFPLVFRNLIVEAKAVYSSSGTRNLHVPAGGPSPGASLVHSVGGTTVAVPTVSLDDVFRNYRRKVSLLKIDVEGAELDVFKGAERLLSEQSPLLVFECENRHLNEGCVEDVVSHLKRRGYDGSFVHGRRLVPVSQ